MTIRRPPIRAPRLAAAIFAGLVAMAPTVAPTVASADTFRAMLGGRVLGTLDYRAAGGGAASLRTTLDNTPLGVGDGVYDGQSQRLRSGGATVRRYTGDSVSSRKSRRIAVEFSGARVVDVAISPAGERTALSDPSAVPEGALDPVMAFGRMVEAGDCPQAFMIYDGRRVIRVRPTGSEVEGAQKRCRLSYDVIAGPGHLSPFRFTALRLDLVYRAGVLAVIEVRTGPFTLTLQR